MSKRIQFVVGATGTGKSSLALQAASKLSATIINADSVQLYKRVNIGANKPSLEDFNKCPHELFSQVDFPQEATASDYIKMAQEVLSERDETEYLLVGGSGFYIQALEKGMFEVAPVAPGIIERVREIEAQGRLLEELKQRDPVAASSIHPNDHYRLQRALQIILSEGCSLEEVKKSTEAKAESPLGAYRVRKLGLYFEREELREIIHVRTQKMLQQGLLEEVRSLLKETSADWTPMKSIGYLECVEHIKSGGTEKDLLDKIVRNTMALAKKQQTWFKRDKEIRWFHAGTQLQEALEYLIITP